MPLPEQRDRLRRMRTTVAGNDASQWARSILESVAEAVPVEEQEISTIAAALAPLSFRPLAPSDASAS